MLRLSTRLTGPLMSALRTPSPKLAIGLPTQQGKRFPFLMVDRVWAYAPAHLVQDKYWYVVNIHMKATCIATFIFWWRVHAPFEGADYDNVWLSPRYRWRMASLKASGQYEENMRIKHWNFYTDDNEGEGWEGAVVADWRELWDNGTY